MAEEKEKEKQQLKLFKVRDLRKPEMFKIDDAYLNSWARFCGNDASLVYMSLCRHAQFDSQTAFPSQEKIAFELGISKRTVIRGLKKLIEYNIISVSKQRKQGKFMVNIYTLLDKSEWKKPDQVTKTTHGKPSDKNRVTFTAYDKCHTKDNKEQRGTNIKENKYTTTSKEVGKIHTSPESGEVKEISKEVGKTRPSYGNEDINYLIEKFHEITDLKKLDGSIRQNRRYCWLLLKKVGGKKENVENLIKLAVKDPFHRANLTSFKYLYYNAVKILNQIKVAKETPRAIEIKIKK